ncbi:MAG: (2Fe-2S)-binding protein [Gemmataceae bacterium]|nr:(2Fe-2S)-binding protein [Gemmataceae bacterium]MCS7271463.1 (2Fe-2S)-binding protein [Gemmataceae bacterium]MDW8243403.1 (2Fe-2S)-binding protein [Thermogemmata sp.]
MSQPKQTGRDGITRRGFLTGSGLAAATVGTLSSTAPAALDPSSAATPIAFGPAPVRLAFTVNGRPVQVQVEPRVTLLDALRNYLDVTGCKRVCDRGTCGACTVQVDGRAVYACTLLAIEARGKDIRTAENLAQGDTLDAVPAAFVRCDAQQCGFCTPGFVMALRAALDKNPRATVAELEQAVAGNICRCGTYEQMRQAIAQLVRKEG